MQMYCKHLFSAHMEYMGNVPQKDNADLEKAF